MNVSICTLDVYTMVVNQCFPDGPENVSLSLVSESEHGQLYYNKCPGLDFQVTCEAFHYKPTANISITETRHNLPMSYVQCGAGCTYGCFPSVSGDYTFRCKANNKLNTNLVVYGEINTTLVVRGNLLLHSYFHGRGGGRLLGGE